MQKLKKGDSVKVVAGRDKGMQGTILEMVTRRDQRGFPLRCALVEGVNVAKKHVRPNPQKETQGGIISREMPIAISNLALLNPLSNKPDKVGIKTLADGKRVRYFKSSGEVVDA